MLLRRVPRYKLVIATCAVAVTSIIVTLFLIESRFGYAKRGPIVVYFQSWDAKRSQGDAFAGQKATLLDQRKQIADAEAKVDKHTNDRDKARLKAMEASNKAAIARLGADKP